MTEEENTLPTAAHEFSKIDHDEEEVWATSKLPPQMLGVSAIEQYELVRRKDVEKLIQHKIDQFNEGRPPEYPQKALKEVLDQVQVQ